MVIEYTREAQQQIDYIFSNNGIYDRYGHFTQKFINWNYEFHRYVGTDVISRAEIGVHGWYEIGKIGMLEYNHFSLDDAEVFEIIQFRFEKLPYKTKNGKGYEIEHDAGYGYTVIRSTCNNKCTILTPRKARLTNFAFDDIIGFHHSSKDYNVLYAVGFMGNRTCAIYMDGDIKLLPYSREEYLNMEHKFYESVQRKKVVLNETQLRRIIRESIKKVLNII